VAPDLVIVAHSHVNNLFQYFNRRRVKQQGAILVHEAAEESFHLRVASGAVERVGKLQLVTQEQMTRPGVAGIDRVLVLMHHDARRLDAQLQQHGARLLPGGQRQGAVGAFTYSPTEGNLAGMADDGHQVSFLPATGIAQLSEIGVQDIEWFNLLELRQEIDSLPGSHDDLAVTAGLGCSCCSQESQTSGLVQPLHYLVVDLLLILLVQLRGRVRR
jgi:hypothetical protein